MDNRRITVSLALIILICFFLPWVHLSCGASTSRLTGVDLARDGHNSLWLIPLLMLALLLVGLARAWKERREISAAATLIGALATTYLMNRERLRSDNSSTLVAARLTTWFWLGFMSAIGLVVLGAFRFLKRADDKS